MRSEERMRNTDPIVEVLKYYCEPDGRDEYLSLHFLGDVPEEIDPEEEADFPEKFQLTTLIETPCASDEVQ